MGTMARTTRKVATPWGDAELRDEVSVAQRSGERRFATVVQLLEGPNGERLVRFAYTTDGVARRGPVTLRERDLEKLCAAAARRPGLAGLFAEGGRSPG
jgi:hypothetical protein